MAETTPARAIVGGANRILATEEAGRTLFRRGIAYAPDFVVNAGKKGTIQTGSALGIMTADKLSMNSKKDMMIGSGAKALFEAKDELTIKCGSAQITLKKNGDISIKGKKITINGSGDIVMKGSKITQN